MPSPADPAVSLRNVSLVFGGGRGLLRDRATVQALRDVDADIPAGEFVTIVGPSGCGKRTLLRLVAGFAEPTAGEVSAAGTPVTGPGPDRGIVFQQPRLFPWLSVRRNVEFGLRTTRTPRTRRGERADELLRLVGLAD